MTARGGFFCARDLRKPRGEQGEYFLPTHGTKSERMLFILAIELWE
jgi:hypothetical protein